LELLEHITACEACAARLAKRTTSLPTLAPPAGLRHEILRKTRPVQPAENLRSYALRVFAAMAAVLVLLFSGAFEKLATLPQELPRITEQISTQFSILNSQFSIQKEESTDASKSQ